MLFIQVDRSWQKDQVNAGTELIRNAYSDEMTVPVLNLFVWVFSFVLILLVYGLPLKGRENGVGEGGRGRERDEGVQISEVDCSRKIFTPSLGDPLRYIPETGQGFHEYNPPEFFFFKSEASNFRSHDFARKISSVRGP